MRQQPPGAEPSPEFQRLSEEKLAEMEKRDRLYSEFGRVLQREPTTPPGYDLRPDIPRRGDVRASTIEENPAHTAAAQAEREAHAAYVEARDRRAAGQATEAEFQAARDAHDAAVTALRSEQGRYRTAPDAPTIAPADQAPVTSSPGTLASFGRAANTEALNAGGGAFAGNVVSGDLTPDPNDQRSPEERIRDAVLHAGVGAAAAVGLRHGGRVARRLGAPEGGFAASAGTPPPGGPIRRSPPTVDDGPLPRGPKALPGPAGRTADDLIVAAHGAVGVPERASVLEPGKLEQWRRNFVRAWTDNRVDLAEAQTEARRLLGRPLTGDEMMLEL
jgi:hypothetical protein